MKILDNEKFNDILSEQLCVVDFSASWCGPCRMLKPIMEQIETLMPDINFYTVDVDDCEDIARQFKIFSVPTILLFKQGKVADTMIGFNTQDDVIEFINRNK